MPLTIPDLQLLLVQRVGDVDPLTGDPVHPTLSGGTGIVLENIGRLWALYEDDAVRSEELRNLEILVAAQDLVIGVLERFVDYQNFDNQIMARLSQRIEARRRQREAWAKEILLEEARIASSGASYSASGLLTTTAPISPPAPGDRPQVSVWGPDANAPYVSGSPYWRRGRRFIR